jgi:predicted permease
MWKKLTEWYDSVSSIGQLGLFWLACAVVIFLGKLLFSWIFPDPENKDTN